MKKLITVGLILGLTGCSLFSSKVQAENIDITGTVQSRCIINTDTVGAYGNPNAYTLNTTAADGGQKPIVRVDVSLANSYYAQVSYPTSFSSSPSLGDTVAWTGAVTAVQTSSSDMSGYQAASTVAGSMRQYALTVAGTTWFDISSAATYGGGQQKPFPGGSYKAVVLAECIAQ
jgi:hypothetical protein|tara:strand:- start:533 stop:1054 length:522 start_codon:yes stop_codon:yes gene_type:complete